MATAVEALRRQRGVLQDPSINDNRLDIDVSTLLLDVVNSNGYDIDVAGSIIDGEIIRTMDGASTISVTVNDHGRKILQSGLIGNDNDEDFPPIDVNFDGLWMRLVQVSKSGDNITFTFEDRIVSYLRSHTKPRKVNRRDMTRAQFIHSMVNEVKATPILFYSPAEDIPQPIEHVDTGTKTRREKKKPGFHKPSKLKVKESKANSHQIDVGATVLAVGSDMGASDKVLASAIAVMTTESGLNPNVGQDYKGWGHIGAFQQATQGDAGTFWKKLGGGTGNLKKDAKAYFTEAIAKEKEFPGSSIAQIASFTQYPGTRPGLESSYKSDVGQWTDNAKEWVKQYTGTGGGSETITQTRRKQFYFMRGQPDGPRGENTWDASSRLAGDVNWRRFVVGNTFFYVRDSDLMKQIAIDTLSESDEAIESIDFDIDHGKPVQEATVTCRAVRWMAHPGEVVILEDCGPANGRWLIQEISKKLFAEDATITLRKPHGSKKEPAPDTVTKSYTKGGGGSGNGKVGVVGKAVLMAGADGGQNTTGAVTHQHVLRFVELMSGALGKTLYICTGTNHNPNTTSGNPSDHWVGDAVDLCSSGNNFRIATPGGPHTGGDDIAQAAAEVLGLKLKDVIGNWNWHSWTYRGVNYRVQVGWRIAEHYNHVHVGVEKLPSGPIKQHGDPRSGPPKPKTSGH